jgi:hypothetical protein
MRMRTGQITRLLIASLGGSVLVGCASAPRDETADAVAWAKAIRPAVQDSAVIQQQRQYREMHDLAFEYQLNSAEEAKIPYTEIIQYPGNWPEISAKRDQRRGQ